MQGFQIYIISRGRADKVHTMRSIPHDLWTSTTIVISSDDDIDKYDKYNAEAGAIIQAPKWVKNYSDKFQFVLENGRYRNCRPDLELPECPKFVIIDDDIWFSKRVGDKLLKCEDINRDMMDMWQQVYDLLDTFPLVGVHPRQMGHLAKLPYEKCGKIICIQAVNVDLFPGKFLPKVNDFPILADVFLNCYLLSKGQPNALVTTYVQDHGSCQAPGGCSLYRTPAMQRQAVEAVVERYGPHAAAVVKRPKSAKWMGDERVDLRVQWKQLYRSGGGK